MVLPSASKAQARHLPAAPPSSPPRPAFSSGLGFFLPSSLQLVLEKAEGRGGEGVLVGGISHRRADLETVHSQANGSPKAVYTSLLRLL